MEHLMIFLIGVLAGAIGTVAIDRSRCSLVPEDAGLVAALELARVVEPCAGRDVVEDVAEHPARRPDPRRCGPLRIRRAERRRHSCGAARRCCAPRT